VGWTDYPSALADLLDSPPDKLTSLGRAGRDWVLQRYAWETPARDLIAFYSRLAATPSPEET